MIPVWGNGITCTTRLRKPPPCPPPEYRRREKMLRALVWGGGVADGVEPPALLGAFGVLGLAVAVEGHGVAGVGDDGEPVALEVHLAAIGLAGLPGGDKAGDGVRLAAPGEAGGDAGLAFGHGGG